MSLSSCHSGQSPVSVIVNSACAQSLIGTFMYLCYLSQRPPAEPVDYC